MSDKHELLSRTVYPVCFGVSGLTLTSEEKQFFAHYPPIGFILFARNIETPEQVTQLVQELRAVAGWHCPILIDQEGGRVARLKPPHWPTFPAMEQFATQALESLGAASQACFANGVALGETLAALDINVNCAPVCDLRIAGAHDIVGDRSFGEDVAVVTVLAQALADGMQTQGVLPIIKHIPGHGRSTVDSHEDLPVVAESKETLDKTDFEVFKRLKHLPFAMTAHIVYSAIDADNPATFSSCMIQEVIRKELGFAGIIFSDDLSMKALTGSMQSRAERAMKAGCDLVLHCNGEQAEMQEVVSGLTPMTASALERFLRYYG